MPTVLLTGANRGLGLALVESFAADGWRVHACCRSLGKSKKIKSLQGDVHVHRLDVTDRLQVANLARSLRDEPIDLLINNAGVMGDSAPFGKVDCDDWLEVLNVNTIAPFRMMERFVDHLAASEKRLIVNVSSIMGSIGGNEKGGHYVYRSSKAALNMVVRSMAIDLAPKGITVVALHPGWVRTAMGGEDAELAPEDAVANLRRLIGNLSAEDSGKFINCDGSPLSW